MTYVIGDVHGNFSTLTKLLTKLPKDSEIYFVGDLIDRGPFSKDVVKLVRENKFKTVLGNHEHLAVMYAEKTITNLILNGEFEGNLWTANGGLTTLLSYGICPENITETKQCSQEFVLGVVALMSDISWFYNLPVDIKLGELHNKTPIILSHSCIIDYWEKFDGVNSEEYYTAALWNRDAVKLNNPTIYNIFGHTPVKMGNHFINSGVNVDTGCYAKEYEGYGYLTAFCLETQEFIYEKNA